MSRPSSPEEYVDENTDELCRIIKHSSSRFSRALALAALVEYGTDPSVESVIEDLERLQDHKNKRGRD